MIRDAITDVLPFLLIVRHHDIEACDMGHPGSVSMIFVICKPPDTHTEQNLPLIDIITTLVDVRQRGIDGPSVTTTAPYPPPALIALIIIFTF